MKYVKRNAIAGRSFASFAELDEHLAAWMREADERFHGTTHEKPSVRFERDEKTAPEGDQSRISPVHRSGRRRRARP